jgi:hypothetical protein
VAVLANHLRGDQRVCAGAGAEIEHPLAGREPASCHGFATPANEPTAVSGTFASSAGHPRSSAQGRPVGKMKSFSGSCETFA